jgi:hypothetical protein
MSIANTIALALVIGALGARQGDRPPKPRDVSDMTARKPDTTAKKSETAIQGCLQGKTLKATKGDTSGSATRTFRLRLSKSLSTALKEHEGHEEEITGVLSDTERTMGGSKSKMVGSRTKITVGASEERNTGAPEDPELQVISFRHVAPTCGV